MTSRNRNAQQEVTPEQLAKRHTNALFGQITEEKTLDDLLKAVDGMIARLLKDPNDEKAANYLKALLDNIEAMRARFAANPNDSNAKSALERMEKHLQKLFGRFDELFAKLAQTSSQNILLRYRGTIMAMRIALHPELKPHAPAPKAAAEEALKLMDAEQLVSYFNSLLSRFGAGDYSIPDSEKDAFILALKALYNIIMSAGIDEGTKIKLMHLSGEAYYVLSSNNSSLLNYLKEQAKTMGYGKSFEQLEKMGAKHKESFTTIVAEMEKLMRTENINETQLKRLEAIREMLRITFRFTWDDYKNAHPDPKIKNAGTQILEMGKAVRATPVEYAPPEHVVVRVAPPEQPTETPVPAKAEERPAIVAKAPAKAETPTGTKLDSANAGTGIIAEIFASLSSRTSNGETRETPSKAVQQLAPPEVSITHPLNPMGSAIRAQQAQTVKEVVVDKNLPESKGGSGGSSKEASTADNIKREAKSEKGEEDEEEK